MRNFDFKSVIFESFDTLFNNYENLLILSTLLFDMNSKFSVPIIFHRVHAHILEYILFQTIISIDRLL